MTENSELPPMIALEEHFFSTYASNDPNYGGSFNGYPSYVNDGLRSLQDPTMRLQCMATGNTVKQILSHIPVNGLGSIELCTSSNNELYDAVQANPSKFVGFALLPMAEPDAAAAELERCVKELGFVGALLGCHLDGTFYDGIKFRPVFNKAVELDVPLYIHPCPPSDSMTMTYQGNYSARVATDLSTFSWGWHEQCGVHLLRLYASRLFEDLPKLKIILGHMGEMLPFSLDRVINFTKKWGGWPAMNRELKQVWDENVWVTTSGMFSLAPFACLMQVTKMDHIMYSLDWPFEDPEEGVNFMIKLKNSGMVSTEHLAMIAYKNVGTLLGVTVD